MATSEADVDRPTAETLAQQGRRLDSLGMLAGGIAHDFNNLLTVITSFGTFVAEEIAQAKRAGCDHLDTAGDDMEKVLGAARRAAGLTKKLLAFGQRQVVRAEVLDVNSVIRRCADLLSPTSPAHIRIALDLTPGPHPILADREQLEQALRALVVNAREAMPDGGTLRIATANVDEGTAQAHVRIQVSDTGHGIPAEIIDKVFEPFFTTKDDCPGAGLGLAAVYGIVAQAGGTIEARSDALAGTVFTMLFPTSAETGQPGF